MFVMNTSVFFCFFLHVYCDFHQVYVIENYKMSRHKSKKYKCNSLSYKQPIFTRCLKMKFEKYRESCLRLTVQIRSKKYLP